MQNYELVGFVSSLNKHAHGAISLTNLIERYQKQFKGFYSNLFRTLYDEYDSSSIVDDYFNYVNYQLHDFSEYSKSYCLETMAAIKTLNVFEHFVILSPKDPNIQENNFPQNSHPQGAFFFAAAAAFMTGDITAPVSIAADILTEKPKPKPKQETEEKVLNPKIAYAFSRIYCINTFSLEFDIVNDELSIVGDKISYEYFIDYMSLIQSNLHVSDFNKRKNIWEQVEALKRVATKMDELVVYELYDKVSDISGARHNPFPKLKTYLSSKLFDISQLKYMLNFDFPISNLNMLKEMQMNEAVRRINAQMRVEQLKKHEDELLTVKLDSEYRVTKNTLQNDLNGNEFEAFANLHIYGPLKRTTKLITRAIIVLPEGVAVGGLQGIYDFLGSIWTIFSGSPITTGFITISSLAIIYSSVANIFNIVFNFVSWMFVPFLIILTPLRILQGYAMRMATLLFAHENV